MLAEARRTYPSLVGGDMQLELFPGRCFLDGLDAPLRPVDSKRHSKLDVASEYIRRSFKQGESSYLCH